MPTRSTPTRSTSHEINFRKVNSHQINTNIWWERNVTVFESMWGQEVYHFIEVSTSKKCTTSNITYYQSLSHLQLIVHFKEMHYFKHNLVINHCHIYTIKVELVYNFSISPISSIKLVSVPGWNIPNLPTSLLSNLLDPHHKIWPDISCGVCPPP